MKLDTTTIIPYPTRDFWAQLYSTRRDMLVKMLGSRGYSAVDCEDAVEEAFHKLMHKKDLDAYGDKLPETEKAWFWDLYWQARAYLSHLKDRADVHAKYVESAAKELEGEFASGHQGESMDEEIRNRALTRALETLRAEQDISKRNLEIYVFRMKDGVPSKVVAEMYNVTANNVDQITWRVGRLVRKHGPRHFEHALKREGYIAFTSVA